ncbi:hypothetical protein AXE85_02840 [Gemella sp. oral taxon 928]|uniref:hypothetical protein n=1 Tax=Gemella sp. oral taxon 928 TaxID=1785995 RepID=UPI0007683670|nr:hypothetical protein [Gemella sp. oral taxon 928]AME09170.1 hypothetical protein AXE85_02840 [Gemella sp. oral taxon 928]
MGFFIAVLGFYLIFLLSFLLTIYIYLRLALAVRAGKDVPKWIYKFGQGFRHRNYHTFDDVTDPIALREATFFIFRLVIINIIVFIVIYYKTYNFQKTLYTCLRTQMAIVLVTMLIHGIIKFISTIRNKSNKPMHVYSSSNAVIGGLFFTSFLLTMFISISGFPAEPITVQVDKTNLVVGQTRASDLLSSGFTFYNKSPDSEIVNKRNDHFYYGELVELVRDGKPYGYVSLTPEWSDSDKVKNCIVTFCEIKADNEQLSKIRFNNKDLSKLTIKDFKTRKLTDIFSLNPVDYEEIKNDIFFCLKLQTSGYALWKTYRIEANFNSDYTPDRYGVRAQHTIWE